MLVDEIYHSLRTVDPELSISRFCVEYLDTSRSYLFNRRNKGKDVSAEVLLNLYRNLRRTSATFLQLANDNNRTAQWTNNWQRLSIFHEELASSVMQGLASHSIRQSKYTLPSKPL